MQDELRRARGGVLIVGVIAGVIALSGCDGETDPDAGLDGSRPRDAAGDAAGRDAASADGAIRDGGSDGGGEPLDVATFCAEYHDRLCEWDTTCRSSGPPVCNFPYAADLEESCAAYAAREGAGAMRFDADAAARCLALDFSVCSPRAFDMADCVAAFVGLVPAGGDCYVLNNRPFDEECVDTAYCDLSTTSCPGTCVTFRMRGQTCGGATERCGPADACQGGVCVARASMGEDCTSLPCVAPYVCVSGRCGSFAGLGDACVGVADCLYPYVCDGGSCVASVAHGAACTADVQCPSGDECLPVSAPPLHCATPPAPGTPCDPFADRPCGNNASCLDTGTMNECVAMAMLGDPCGAAGCAAGLWCRGGGPGDPPGGACRALGGPTDPCASTLPLSEDRCLAGLYCVVDVCRAPSAAGGPCDPIQYGTCERGLWCDGAMCRSPGALSDACDPNWVSSCDAATYCDATSMTCVARRPLDALCNGNHECQTGLCAGDSTGIARCATPCTVPTTRS